MNPKIILVSTLILIVVTWMAGIEIFDPTPVSILMSITLAIWTVGYSFYNSEQNKRVHRHIGYLEGLLIQNNIPFTPFE